MKLENGLVDTKVKLAASWAALIAFYIYADFLSLYRPGQIDEIRRGVMGPLEVSQAALVAASLIVIIPAVMIVMSLLLPAGVNRAINLVLAVLYTLVNISNLFRESWVYYFLFGIAEVAVTILIFSTAWRWPRKAVTE